MKRIETDLLLGGPYDGERRKGLYGTQMIVADAGSEARTNYNLRRVTAGDTVFDFWQHADLSDEDALDLLFKNYKP